MSEGSRFASLGRRARALLGSGETSVLAIVAEEGTVTGHQAGGEGAVADAVADALDDGTVSGISEPPAPTPDPAPAPEAPAADAGQAVAAARAEERARMSEVFASEHVKGRESAAVCLLTETDMAADKIVAKLPTLSPAAAADPMLGALAGTKNPDLGAGAEATGTTKTGIKVWDKIRDR